MGKEEEEEGEEGEKEGEGSLGRVDRRRYWVVEFARGSSGSRAVAVTNTLLLHSCLSRTDNSRDRDSMVHIVPLSARTLCNVVGWLDVYDVHVVSLSLPIINVFVSPLQNSFIYQKKKK